MTHTTTRWTHHRLKTGIVAAALLLTAGCAPVFGTPPTPPDDTKPPPMNAIVAGGRDSDEFTGVAMAGDGNIIAVGSTYSTDGDFPPIHDYYDTLIANYSLDGTQQWAKTASGSDNGSFDDVAVASDGSIIAVGSMYTTDGDSPPSNAYYDALIVKYSPDGTQQWARTTGGSENDEFRSVAVASDGSIIAVGFTYSTDGNFPPGHGQRDAVIVKYAPDGTQQWAKTTGGSDDDDFASVAVTSDGSIIAVGFTDSTDGVFPPSHGQEDALIVKYSPDGTQQWAKTPGGSYGDSFEGVAAASDGSIIAVGSTYSTDGDFPPCHGYYDALIVKYSPDGTQQWAKTPGGSGGDGFRGVAVTSDGSIIAVGSTDSTDADFPLGHGFGDALIVKYSPDGTQYWANTSGGTDSDGLVQVSVASGGSIIAVGYTSSEDGDFPPTHGSTDALLVILRPDMYM